MDSRYSFSRFARAMDESTRKAREESRQRRYLQQVRQGPQPPAGLDLTDPKVRAEFGLPELPDPDVAPAGSRTLLGGTRAIHPQYPATPARNPGEAEGSVKPLVDPAGRGPVRELERQFAAEKDPAARGKLVYCPQGGAFGCPSRGFAAHASRISNYAMADPDSFAMAIMFAPLSAMLPFNIYAPRYPWIALAVSSVGEGRDDLAGTATTGKAKTRVSKPGEVGNAIVGMQQHIDAEVGRRTISAKREKDTSKFNVMQLVMSSTNARVDMLTNLWNQRQSGYAKFKAAKALVDGGDSDQAHHAILDCYDWLVNDVGGMQGVKAGFAIQLCLNLQGCIDVHNIAIYSALVEAYFGKSLEDMVKERGASKGRSPSEPGSRELTGDSLINAIRGVSDSKSLSAIQGYMDLLRQLNDHLGVGTANLWNFWCDYVAQYHSLRYSGHWNSQLGSVYQSDDEPDLARALPHLRKMGALPRWVKAPGADAGDAATENARLHWQYEAEMRAWLDGGRKGKRPVKPKALKSVGRGADLFLGGAFPHPGDPRHTADTGRFEQGRDRTRVAGGEEEGGVAHDPRGAVWERPWQTEPGRRYGHAAGNAVSLAHLFALGNTPADLESQGYGQNLLRKLLDPSAKLDDIPVLASLGPNAGPESDRDSFFKDLKGAAQGAARWQRTLDRPPRRYALEHSKAEGRRLAEGRSWFGLG